MDLLDFYRVKRQLKEVTEFMHNIIDETEKIYNKNNHVDFSNYTDTKIRIKLMPLLINGVDIFTAKSIVCEQLGLNYQFVSNKVNSEFYNWSSRMKTHKIYACHKLHEAGIKNKQIAELLHCSPALVSKYLCIPTRVSDD